MVIKQYNKKGQAAIEFLMTYGWMLLVVLIVGALIFSFVDFGSLLPAKFDLSGNLRADGTQIYATAGNQYISTYITYVGSKTGKINISKVDFTSADGTHCDFNTNATGGYIHIKNKDTGAIISTNNASSTSDGLVAVTSNSDTITFINGQTAIITFGCPTDTLMSGDTVDGSVVIPVQATVSGFISTSKGALRTTIED